MFSGGSTFIIETALYLTLVRCPSQPSLHLAVSGCAAFVWCEGSTLYLPTSKSNYSALTVLTLLFAPTELDSEYPGIVFFKTSTTKRIMPSTEATIHQLEDMGISINVPSCSVGEPSSVHIRSCFSGPFELPEQYESASPTYLICHGKMDFQKDITLRIHHYASLHSEEDCEDMAFLSASSTPEYGGSRPLYTFNKILGTKGVFRPGEQVGEISLRHFCLVKIGKRNGGMHIWYSNKTV